MDDLLIPLARREVMAELPAERRVAAVVPVLFGGFIASATGAARGVSSGGSDCGGGIMGACGGRTSLLTAR